MNGITAFEAMSNVSDSLIMEAAEKLGAWDASAMRAPREKKAPGAFSRFMNSGWGVAAVCTLVAVSVMGGIIWAGHQAGHQPPVVTPEETTTPFEVESENEDYIGEDQTEVTVRHGNETIYPRKFCVWSGPADGFGFEETIRQESSGVPCLPTIHFAKDAGESAFELHLENRSFLLRGVSFYDDDMNETAIAYDGEFHYGSFLKDLPVGRHHVCLYVEYTEDGEAVSGADYAFTVVVTKKIEEVTQTEPVFSVDASLEAIDQLASENFSVNLQYKTTTANRFKESFRGNFGQVNGKHWSYVSNEGAVVQEAEGGYYHKYVLDFSKWTYYDTYTMTDNHAFEEVYNGRYWWENYLRELKFEAYDELIYVGTEQILEKNCYMFSFDGTVEDVGHVKLGLSVDAETNNVLKMTLKIEYSGAAHVNDVVEATIEALSIRMGDDAKGPTLPDPKWNPPSSETASIP